MRGGPLVSRRYCHAGWSFWYDPVVNTLIDSCVVCLIHEPALEPGILAERDPIAMQFGLLILITLQYPGQQRSFAGIIRSDLRRARLVTAAA